jgi:hypothetical protein
MADLLKPYMHLLICQLQKEYMFDEDITRIATLLPDALLPEQMNTKKAAPIKAPQ